MSDNEKFHRYNAQSPDDVSARTKLVKVRVNPQLWEAAEETGYDLELVIEVGLKHAIHYHKHGN